MPSKRRGTTRSQSSTTPIILLIIGAVLVLGALVFALVNGGSQPAVSNPANTNLPYPNIGRVSLADAKAALDQNTAVFVDVRDASSYETSHVKGAVSLPLSKVESGRFGSLDKNQWIITYCT